mmetsp:Transcript_8090/g.18075  ORF Transcript_8090/g.18075 Transcript_8090/m.18075 type:complete len:520 (+) Transcript_8090:132-1691(+)
MSDQPIPTSVNTPHFAAAGTGGGAPAPGPAAAGNQTGQLSAPTAAAVANRGTPATLNLDDIFGDCFFTPDGDAVFLNDQPEQEQDAVVASAEAVPTSMASRPVPAAGAAAAAAAPTAAAPAQVTAGGYVPVSYGGGIATTGLDTAGAKATVMGTVPSTAGAATAAATAGGGAQGRHPGASLAPPTKAVPFVQPPQQRHHLQYATPAMLGQRGTSTGAAAAAAAAKRKTSGGSAGGRSGERKMSDKQKTERRERNREHAKRSRIRKKFLLESLQQSVALLKDENDKLRGSIREHLGDEADDLLTKENLAEAAAAGGAGGGLIAGSTNDANKVLDDPDFSFIKALQTAQQNFVVTDPSLPDNPIVYATQGFLNLTGYTLDQVLGRNCRFLQGPETDPKAVEKIRRAIEEGTDMSVCLLNYRVDGTTFWNQFFIAALRDAAGNITNYVGVQCKVSDQYAANVCKRQEEADMALADGGGASAAAPAPDGGATAASAEAAQAASADGGAAAAPVAAPGAPVAAS